MPVAWFRTIVAAFVCVATARAESVPAGDTRPTYPKTRQLDLLEELHGAKVPDPYRWLEDLDAPEVKAWIDAQNRVTEAYLETIPRRPAIRTRLEQLWNFERYSVPIQRGGRYFFTRNDGLQNQSVLYVAESLSAEPRVLLDPNLLSKDGTVALTMWTVSDDGTQLAYGTSAAGSDWTEIRVRSVATAEDAPDLVKWVKFSGLSWGKDGRGFYYSRYDEPKSDEEFKGLNYFQKLYYHALGTPQSQDRLVYHRPDHKEWGFIGAVTDDGRYLVIHVTEGTDPRNRVYYIDLQDSPATVVPLLDEKDAKYEFIDNDGPVMWFLTDLDAPRARVIAIDTRTPDRSAWKELIPQTSDTLREVSSVGGRLIASYLQDAHSTVRMHALDGKHLRDLELPGLGSAGGFTGRRCDRETFYSFTGFSRPGTIYRYDLKRDEATVFRSPKLEFDPADYVTKQVFYTSRDGTRVPMFITHRRDLRPNPSTPVLLYGYGGFEIPITPGFSTSMFAWMEMGGVYAVANIRGGGEYGKAWHDAGRLKNKQNTFDDFIAAAEYLIQQGMTSREKLAISGGSNGGLLVGACITQRPDLFAAALPAVGVMDMLRFHKFTIGWAWTSDYGSPDDPEMFKVLYSYSPLHRIRPGTSYPATLITTGDHDDRVMPSHSFKFAAALQAAQAGPAPILIRIETRAGHGAGKPTSKQIDEAADRLAFLTRVLRME